MVGSVWALVAAGLAVVVWFAFGRAPSGLPEKSEAAALSQQPNDAAEAGRIENGKTRRQGEPGVKSAASATRDHHRTIEIKDGKIVGGATSSARTSPETHSVIDIANGKVRTMAKPPIN